jgi:hypothetical protein
MNATALVLMVALSGTPAEPASETPWTQVHDGDVKVYAREHAGGRVLEVKGEAVLDASPLELQGVFLDQDPHRPKTPYVVESRLVKTLDDHRTVRYQHLAFPVISDRDYFMEVNHESLVRPDGTGTYRSSWKPWGAELPARDGIVRVTTNEGYWEITAAGQPDHAHVTYYVYSDPGGALPAWVINMGNKRVLPDLIHHLEERVVEYRAREKAERAAKP